MVFINIYICVCVCVCAIIYKFKQVLSVSYKRVYPWIWVLLVEIMFDHGVSCRQTKPIEG
jgi:hypothetical protein